MKVVYIANDGREFSSSDECLAWEEDTEKKKLAWESLLEERKDGDLRELYSFVGKISILLGWDTNDFWVYRRRFIELAKTFAEVDDDLAG